MDEPRPLTPGRAVGRGITRRCPLCGERGVFVSWFTRRDRCPTCNYPTTRVHDQWIGAVGINTIVSFGTLLCTIAVGFTVTYPDPSVGPLLAVAVSVAVVVPVAFLPLSRSVWSAIDLAMRPPEPSDDVDPRYLPPTGR